MAESVYVVTYATPDDSNLYGVALLHTRSEAETALEAMDEEYYEGAEYADEEDADDPLPSPYRIEECDPEVFREGEIEALEQGNHVVMGLAHPDR